MVPLLKRSAIFPLNSNSIASMRQKIFSTGRTNREGALLRYSCRRGSYNSVGLTNRGVFLMNIFANSKQVL